MTPTRKNAAPEGLLQKQVVEWLGYVLPGEVLWSASAAGVRVSMHAAVKMKAQGVRRGFPDLAFILPDGITYYAELKRPDGGALSPEQKVYRGRLLPLGRWALVRSIEDMEAALVSWNVKLRSHPFAKVGGSYGAP